MRLAAHQPDLLPWSGFWWKMAHADVFDLAVWDQFQSRGYQRRVKMRDQWCSLPLIGKPSMVQIVDVQVAPNAKQVLLDTIEGRYRGARHFDNRWPILQTAIDLAFRSTWLWQVNLTLILAMRQWLEIDTPIAIAGPPVGKGVDGLVDLADRQYRATTYLSGEGGREYMGEWTGRAALEWSSHQPVTGDSIVSVLMDYADPPDVIRACR